MYQEHIPEFQGMLTSNYDFELSSVQVQSWLQKQMPAKQKALLVSRKGHSQEKTGSRGAQKGQNKGSICAGYT